MTTGKLHARRGTKGAVALEMALVLPLLLALVLASIDWGWYFFVDQVVTNAAREGARAGSVVDPALPSADAATTAQTAAQLYLTHLGLSDGTATAEISTVGGVDAVRVVVVYPAGSLTGWFSGIIPENAQATAIMRWQ